jgi:peptidoglycan/xylan/chitin deacetylase (PgdA/CDA1 family)
MSFWIKTNRIVKLLFPKHIWSIPNNKNHVFITFDDGPTPEITEWVLEQLNLYQAKATFFCIGNNIEKHSDIFKKIQEAGHAIGNHTFNHLNGWKTSTQDYINDVKSCQTAINYHQHDNINLYRPPYGKIKPSQSKKLRKDGYKIIMWDVLSCDYDTAINQEQYLNKILSAIESGSIIVFHDSIKASKNLKFLLPKTLTFLSENGYSCEKINFL